jgi:small-conductance mechanosensitive channel
MDFANIAWLEPSKGLALPAIGIAAAVTVGIVANKVLFAVVGRLARQSSTELDDLFVRYGKGPGRILLPLVLLIFVAPVLGLSPQEREIYDHMGSLTVITACTYLALNMTKMFGAYVVGRHKHAAAGSLDARRIITQVGMLQKVVLVVVAVLGFSCALMTFEGVRQVGVSILASAGLAGVVFGFAAQRSIGTLLAGIQIAITQPIRIDDAVVVEGEFGSIEEISLTYVVVRIWDQRRLIVPITYFIEKPLQNWTRVSAEILGTVFLYVDYTVSVDAVRGEVRRLLEANDLWDKRVANVQVTDTKPNAVELRVLVSASDASKCWDLRCQLREKLVDFVRTKYPGALPRVRAEMALRDAPSSGRAESVRVALRSD